MYGPGQRDRREDYLLALAGIGIGVLVAATLVTWGAGELGSRLLHGRWIPLAFDSAAPIFFHLVQNPSDPAAAWPAGTQQLVPSTPIYYALAAVLLLVEIAVVWLAAWVWLRYRHPAPPGGRRKGWSSPRQAGLLTSSGPRAYLPSRNVWLGFTLRPWYRPWARWGRTCRTPTTEESTALVGPARSGKTLGNITPAVLLFDGSVVVTSTKPDVLRLTGGLRQELARASCGTVHLLDLSEVVTDAVGMRTVRWSPLDGCEDTRVCMRRVNTLLNAADNDDRRAEFWDNNAARVLRPYFHAAALSGRSIRDVMRWLDVREFEEPARIIDGAQTARADARHWGRGLRNMAGTYPPTIDGYFETARACLRALEEPVVLANCADPDFDVDRFLSTSSTLYVVDPGGEGKVSPTAPLVAALIEWIVDRAFARARAEKSERCEPPLFLALDEVANIAPLPSLPNLLSQGGGHGVVVTWASQSFAQMRDRYGDDLAGAILSNSTNRIVFGGLFDRDDLEDVSALVGDYEDWQQSHGESEYGQTVSWQLQRRRVLPVEKLARVPRGRALLIHAGNPTWLAMPPAPTVPQLAALLGPPKVRPQPGHSPSAPVAVAVEART